jgi:hypothetical protein
VYSLSKIDELTKNKFLVCSAFFIENLIPEKEVIQDGLINVCVLFFEELF